MIVRHLKNKKPYLKLFKSKIKKDDIWEDCIIYICLYFNKDGMIWVRYKEDFNKNLTSSSISTRAKSLAAPTTSQRSFTKTSSSNSRPSTSGFKSSKPSSSWSSSSSSRSSSRSSGFGSSSRSSSSRSSGFGSSSRSSSSRSSSSRSSSSRRR